MELWIRSQDKEDLIKVDNLGLAYLGKYNFVDKIGDIHRKEYHICQFEENCHTTLGYYKTKERAIEVLDEIHKCIVDKEVLDGNNNILTLANKNSLNEVKQILARTEEIAVYEMPKE